VAFCAFGLVVASTGRFSGTIRDTSRSRRPTGIIAAVSCFIGVVLLAIGLASADSHARLTELALATILLSLAAAGVAMVPVARFWTNEYWGMPAPESITSAQLRTLGHAYATLGLALVIACVAGLIGLIPKLVYVGEGSVWVMFLIADIALVFVAVAVAISAWKSFRSVRVDRSEPKPIQD
jgi:hypothetical protein